MEPASGSVVIELKKDVQICCESLACKSDVSHEGPHLNGLARCMATISAQHRCNDFSDATITVLYLSSR